MSAPLVDIASAQELLGGISRTTLFRLLKEGDLGVVKLGRRTMIPAADIADFIQRATTRSEAEREQARVRLAAARRVTCRRCGAEHQCQPSPKGA